MTRQAMAIAGAPRRRPVPVRACRAADVMYRKKCVNGAPESGWESVA